MRIPRFRYRTPRVARALLAGMLGEQTHDFAGLRVAMQLRFLEDRLCIDCDFKTPT